LFGVVDFASDLRGSITIDVRKGFGVGLVELAKLHLSLANVQDEPRPLGAVGSGAWFGSFFFLLINSDLRWFVFFCVCYFFRASDIKNRCHSGIVLLCLKQQLGVHPFFADREPVQYNLNIDALFISDDLREDHL
jgi:hypothetical protein